MPAKVEQPHEDKEEEKLAEPAQVLGALAPEEDVKSTTSSKKRKRSDYEAKLV